MRIALYFLFLPALFITLPASAQKDSTRNRNNDKDDLREKSFLERSYTGGNGGLYFNNGGAYLDISPLYGYKLTEYFSVGVTATYKFLKYYDPNSVSQNTSHIFGFGGFGRMLVFDFLFAHAEAELVNTEVYDVVIKDYTRKFIPVTSAGLGLKSRDRDYYSYFMILYDFVQDPYSPYDYTSPLVLKAGIIIPLGQ